jgi:hypothetical protein
MSLLKNHKSHFCLAGAEVELVMPTTMTQVLPNTLPSVDPACTTSASKWMISRHDGTIKSKNIRLINEEPRTAADGKNMLSFIQSQRAGCWWSCISLLEIKS